MFGAFADMPLQYLLLKGAPVIQDHEPQPLEPPTDRQLAAQMTAALKSMVMLPGDDPGLQVGQLEEDEPEYEVVITFLDETHVHADSVEVEGKWVHVHFDDGGQILWNTDFVDIISMAYVPVGDVHKMDPGDVCLDKLAEMEEDLEDDGEEESYAGGVDLDLSSYIRKNN